MLALRYSFIKTYNFINEILEVYRAYPIFAKSVQEKGFPVRRILQGIEEEFHKRLYLLDRDNRLITGNDTESVDEILSTFIQLLSAKKIGSEVGGKSDIPPCEIYSDGQGQVAYFCKIYVNGCYDGQLMLLGHDTDEDDLATLVLQMSRCLTQCLEQVTIWQNRSQNSMENLLDNILQRKLRDVQDYFDAFRELPYPARKNCQCVLIRFEHENLLNRPYAYLMAELRKIFPETNMAVYHNEVVLLLTSEERRTGLTKQEKQQLEELLKEYSACAAVGNSFFRIDLFRTQYLMIHKLLRIGMAVRFKDTERIFEHERYSVYLLLELAMEAFPREYHDTNYAFLIHSNIVQLVRYDLQHKTNLMELLHLYLMNNQNVNNTAEETFLHRNTVRNKINQIRAMLTCDLDDPALQYQMLVSCSLMRYCRLVLNRDLLESNLDYWSAETTEQEN